MSKVCGYCQLKVESSEATVDGKCFHTECFVCANCKQGLLNCSFRMRENVLYCNDCFSNMKAVLCAECKHAIRGTARIEAMGQFYHPRHFVCFHCKGRLVKGLYKKKLINVNGEIRNCAFCPFCEDDFEEKTCPKCKKALNDQLIVEGDHYIHMDCESAKDRTKAKDRGIYKADGKIDSSDSDSDSSETDRRPEVESEDQADRRPEEEPEAEPDTDLHFSCIPEYTTSFRPTSEPAKPAKFAKPAKQAKKTSPLFEPTKTEYRPADFTSDPRSHTYGFESQGKVIERKDELFKKEEYVPKEADMTGFESEGKVLDRSEAWGQNQKPAEVPKENHMENFENTGKVRDRAAMFGQSTKPLESIDEEAEEEKKFEGFSSAGNFRDRLSMFEPGKKTESEPAAEPAKEKKFEDFSSAGNFRDRLSMFEPGKKPLESIDEEKQENDVDHHPVKADKEYMERQKKLAALPRDQLKEYSYEELTGETIPDDVDRERRQYHLSDKEFKKIFGMSKKEFSKKSESKQISLRKKHNLF